MRFSKHSLGSALAAALMYLSSAGALAQTQGDGPNPFLDPEAEKRHWLIAQQANQGNGQVAPGQEQNAQQGNPSGAAAAPQQPQVFHGNVAAVQPLPSPKLDIKQEVLNQVAPMDPELVRQVIAELESRRAAASVPAQTNIKAALSTFDVDLSPGATPPVVRIARGQGAVVTFLDSAGNPWPILAAENFYVQAMGVKQLGEHVLAISANSDYLRGSVGVMLKGLATPVTFTVIPGVDNTDYRVDLRVPGIAPGAAPSLGNYASQNPVGSADLMAYLYGQTPEGASPLRVQGPAGVKAWQSINGDLILRTSALVASPAWSERLPSADGTSVYRLPLTPVVLVSINGKLTNIDVSGMVPNKNNAEMVGFLN